MKIKSQGIHNYTWYSRIDSSCRANKLFTSQQIKPIKFGYIFLKDTQIAGITIFFKPTLQCKIVTWTRSIIDHIIHEN